jgi:hypothetical protein
MLNLIDIFSFSFFALVYFTEALQQLLTNGGNSILNGLDRQFPGSTALIGKTINFVIKNHT